MNFESKYCRLNDYTLPLETLIKAALEAPIGERKKKNGAKTVEPKYSFGD